MLGIRARLVVTVAAAGFALSGCTSIGTNTRPVSTQNGTPTSTTQKAAPTPVASRNFGSKDASGDVKLGVLRVDPKLGTPSAAVTITNHSSKKSNYIVDLSITSADGKTTLDAAVVSVQSLAPGKTAKRAAQFMTTQKLPTGATLTVVGIARLVT